MARSVREVCARDGHLGLCACISRTQRPYEAGHDVSPPRGPADIREFLGLFVCLFVFLLPYSEKTSGKGKRDTYCHTGFVIIPVRYPDYIFNICSQQRCIGYQLDTWHCTKP